MEREEFQKIVDGVTGGEYVPAVRANKSKGIKGHRSYMGPTKEIKLTWVVGGMYGGNCWGDNPSYNVESEPEPEFDDLDEILMQVCPNLSFLAYKKISKLIEYSDYSTREYYGNYTDYRTKTINIDSLWECLEELGYVNT